MLYTSRCGAAAKAAAVWALSSAVVVDVELAALVRLADVGLAGLVGVEDAATVGRRCGGFGSFAAAAVAAARSFAAAAGVSPPLGAARCSLGSLGPCSARPLSLLDGESSAVGLFGRFWSMAPVVSMSTCPVT